MRKTRHINRQKNRAYPLNTLQKAIIFLSVLLSVNINAESKFDSLRFDDTILRLMGNLETARDPKCHATATRLEGLIYGTPLSEEARNLKTELQKALVKEIWQRGAALNKNTNILSLEQAMDASNSLFETQFVSTGRDKDHPTPYWIVKTPIQTVEITDRDQKHYGSIAYTLRAMLAVQQDTLLDLDSNLPFLSDLAVKGITEKVDLMTLSLLKIADDQARSDDSYSITSEQISTSWKQLFSSLPIADAKPLQPAIIEKPLDLESGLLISLIDQKIASFKAYNDINQTLFARNLQVYFAKLALPKDPAKVTEFKKYFTEAMIAFTGTLYLDAQARAQGRTTINEGDVSSSLLSLLPHTVNEYEDVIFFPDYPKNKQIIIESYDMDSFRDSGLHWRYFREALVDAKASIKLETDPFAAELLSEAVAHYGVLLLRRAGIEAKNISQESLDSSQITLADKSIHSDVEAYRSYKPVKLKVASIISAGGNEEKPEERYFVNVTDKMKLIAEHRSSDWLSRQLRGYLEKDAQTGIITIPPAFGGSGIAAEDINKDGLTDILILSGLGNKLFVNRGDYFEDISSTSGLNNKTRRKGVEQGSGEPRQPLIADWDNDGDQDIIITYVDELHHVYRNDGNLKFTEVSELAALGGDGLVGGPATTFDVNNDGLLDIYIEYFGNYLKGDLPTLKRRNINGTKNTLFINRGGFKFEQAPDALGADNSGWGQAVTHTDLNQDGWQDLIVGNDFGVNAYYINQQGKHFVDYASKIGTDKPSYTMSIGLSDLNQDGTADIYVSNIVTMNKDQKYVLPSEDTTMEFNPAKLANMRVVEGNDLFISSRMENGSLKYQHSDLVGRGFSSTGWAWDADFFDVDNDGDDDLYVLNGMNDYYVYSTDNPYYNDPFNGERLHAEFPDAAKASNVFFINGGGKLSNVSALSGLDIISNSRSAAYLDIENDGDLDVVINNYHGASSIFKNQAEKLGNNWIKIKLQGSPKDGVNLDAIGATILIGSGKNGYSWRQVSGSQGYMSVHPKTQHIGLGKARSARVMVIWPDGKRERFDDLKSNKSYTIRYKKT